MERKGWNPTRRNRNIGTRKQGHGRDNRDGIPHAWPDDRVFWEVVRDAVVLPQTVNGNDFHLIVEPTTPGFVHACTPADILRVVELVPPNDFQGIELFVLRQPTRRQARHSSVWGRLGYYAEICGHAGAAIILEAMEPGCRVVMGRSMSVDRQREVQRLREDGHPFEEDRKTIAYRPTLTSARATQLYRTLFHEVGHWVDFMRSVEDPAEEAEEYCRLADSYWSRPSQQKEAYAEGYAQQLRRTSTTGGALPFERIFDPAQLRAAGMQPDWFDEPAP